MTFRKRIESLGGFAPPESGHWRNNPDVEGRGRAFVEMGSSYAFDFNGTGFALYLFWQYGLPDGDHEVEVRLLNPTGAARVMLDGVAVYGAGPNAAN